MPFASKWIELEIILLNEISQAHRTPIAQEIKARINHWDRFKLKSFLLAKETLSNVNREPTEWENIFATHTSDRQLISRIYKEHKKTLHQEYKQSNQQMG